VLCTLQGESVDMADMGRWPWATRQGPDPPFSRALPIDASCTLSGEPR
jgi:hypothetical protein